ncbi:MAG: hypothetical protein J6T57_02180 [Alphaproteobacteria bacterium]|nr:hypothetical protein [Alphaproteobacteria bacterium]
MKKISLALASILAACAAQNYTPENIIIEDGNYIKEISAKSVVRPSDGFTSVSINGETYEDTTLYYRVVWFDVEGTQINSGATDRPVQANIRRNIPFNWHIVSPSNNAHSYKVYISNRPIRQ